jgi:hypothetical protein
MAEPEEPLDSETRLQLYLETLRARMDPARYAAFERLVAGTAQAMRETAAGRPEAVFDLPDEDGVLLGQDLVGEMLTVMSILTGRDDQARVVQLGDGVTALVDVDAAEDPQQMAEAREAIQRLKARREYEAEQLDGIARASSLDDGGQLP